MRTVRNLGLKMLDFLGMVVLLVIALPMKVILPRRYKMHGFSRMSDRFGLHVRNSHFYEPTYSEADLPAVTNVERSLPAIDLNAAGQLALLAKFTFADELAQIPLKQPSATEYGYDMQQYGSGDSEIAYSMIRHFKPRRIMEIGSGASTLISLMAVNKNRSENAAYICEQTCIEPYLQPWLEQVPVTTIRQRVELLDLALFDQLEAGDILLIDSSHVIRPWGDVLFEYHQIIPRLKPGVLVHIHDIFTPRDYPEQWLRAERRLWNEQYLLESYLAFNSKVEVICAANWLKHNHFAELAKACPVLGANPQREPGAFWFRTR